MRLLAALAFGVLRQNAVVLLQQFDALREGESIGDAVEIAEMLDLAQVNRLKQQGLARELNVHVGGFPAVGCDLGLRYEKVSTLVQVAENAPSEIYAAEQGSFDFHKALVFQVQ